MNSIDDVLLHSTLQSIYNQEDVETQVPLYLALRTINKIRIILARDRSKLDSKDAFNAKNYIGKVLARPEVRKNQELKENLKKWKKNCEDQIRWQSEFYNGNFNYNNHKH